MNAVMSSLRLERSSAMARSRGPRRENWPQRKSSYSQAGTPTQQHAPKKIARTGWRIAHRSSGTARRQPGALAAKDDSPARQRVCETSAYEFAVREERQNPPSPSRRPAKAGVSRVGG